MSLAESLLGLTALFLPAVFARFLPPCGTDNQSLVELGLLTMIIGCVSQNWVSEWAVRMVALATLSYAIVRIGIVRRPARSLPGKIQFAIEPLYGVGLSAVCLLIQRQDPGSIFRGPFLVFLLSWSSIALASRKVAILSCLTALALHFPR